MREAVKFTKIEFARVLFYPGSFLFYELLPHRFREASAGLVASTKAVKNLEVVIDDSSALSRPKPTSVARVDGWEPNL